MARRATTLERLRSRIGPSRSLFIAGPYELSDPGGMTGEEEHLRAFVRAMQRLGYDLVTLAPEEADLLQRHGIDIPPSWHVLAGEPRLIKRHTAGLDIGILLLPAGERALERSLELLRQAAGEGSAEGCRSLDLLLAVSPWGWRMERDFLRRAPARLDILLGSGRGPYENGRSIGPSRTLWIRPYTRGKAMNRIKVLGQAAQPSQSMENESVHLRTDLVVIEPSTPADPSIRSLFN